MDKSIRIGILFSLSGTMEISERGQYYAALLAIEQINQNGGINGRKIRPFVADSASNPYIAAREAERLIVEHKVAAIIGLYTSASRKEVIPIIEKYHSLLFYPNGYEGEEQHPNIIYCGPLPTQNLIYFIPWIIQNIGKKFYLIGSDYIFPKEMNHHIHSIVQANKGKVLGEDYTLLGGKTFEEQLHNIQKLNPDIIFSTLVGDSAVSFYQQYYETGINKPIASVITAETEIAAIDPQYTAGHYACFPYFDSIESKENKLFLKEFKDLYHIDTVSSVMENAYNSIYLLAEALRRCKTIDTASILENVKGISIHAPQGKIMVDRMNQHVWMNSRIGQVNRNGKFTILWETEHPIQPIPFAKYYFSAEKNSRRSLNQLDEELQLKLKHLQPLMNELKKATQDLPHPLVFFDKDGQLISILNGPQAFMEKLPFLLTGISIWRTPVLKNSGIARSFTTNHPSYTSMDEHMERELHTWTSIGIPVKDKNGDLIGSLGMFIHNEQPFSINLLLSLLSKIVAYCVELVERSDHYILTYELLHQFSSFIDEPLFIMANNTIVFESNSAKQLRINGYNFVIEFIKKMVSLAENDQTRKIVRRKSSNELFEIAITKKGNYYYASVKALDHKAMLKPANHQELTNKDWVGTSQEFLKSLYFAKAASKKDANVLLMGEHGTGKETLARIIHNNSRRKEQPFVTLNCTAAPSHVMNIELFGYEAGMFPETGEQGSPGKFELAEGGTLFLDEIADMPLDLQAAFLRVLQEKKVTRVGGSKAFPVNVRVIAATNKNIQQEIAYKGSLRSDLYFQLNTLLIELPPLRERKEDIPYLVNHFINKLSHRSGETAKEINRDTLHYLMEYNWPGNIRELKNIAETAFYASNSSSDIKPEHLPNYIFENSKEVEEAIPANTLIPKDAKRLEMDNLHKKQHEKVNIVEAMIKFKGNITKTANYLGISRTTLYRKLDELNAKH